MTALVIMIYNRVENLKRWAFCLRKIKRNYRVYVIHNSGPTDEFKAICHENNFVYIARKNIGFDIGAFQDICRGRMQGFADVRRILWVADDTLPMAPNFMEQFEKTMKPGVGVACMQISTSIRPHLRTTGFMIDLEIARRLKFPADPVKTKQDCYLFEHRDPKNTFTEQIRRMGLSVQQVAPIRSSPLWDSAHPNRRLRLNRQFEFDHTWTRKSLLQY